MYTYLYTCRFFVLNTVEQHHCFNQRLQCQNEVLISSCFQTINSVTPEVASSSLVTPAIFISPCYSQIVRLTERLYSSSMCISPARVVLLMNRLEAFAGDVRVHFRCRDT